MSAGPVRIGLIGCGLVARRAHLPAYAASDEARVIAVASGHLEGAREAAASFAVPRVHAAWRDLVDDPEVEAVDICTPNALHAEMAVAAARAGKHVLVEKPMAVSLAEADAMIAAARAAGVVLMVAHNLRFVPLYEEVKRVLDAGTVGRLLTARGAFMHAGPDEFWGATSDWFWRPETAGGGALLDMGIHMIDLLRWFFVQPVVEVAAMTARAVKPTTFDDDSIALLRFEGGAIASVQASWTARPVPDRVVTVFGEKGHVAVGRSATEPPYVYFREGAEERRIALEVPKISQRINPFVHFVRCVRELETPLTSGEEGRATLAVALAAYESARTGRAVRLG